jgi:hypothetical protein
MRKNQLSLPIGVEKTKSNKNSTKDTEDEGNKLEKKILGK